MSSSHTPTTPPVDLRSRLLLGLVVAVVAGAAGWLWQLSRQRSPLAVAITTWPGYEYLYLAEQQQLGRAYGLQLKVLQYSSLVDQRQAYERGDVPALATTVPEAIAICQEAPQRCPQLVLVLDESSGADRIVSRIALRTPQQLLGSRVGLERSVLGEYMLVRSFGAHPPSLSQLRLHFDGPTALVKALQAGDLDAIVTYAPHDTPLLGDPRFRVLFSSRSIPGEVVDVLAVDPAFAQRNPNDVKALVQTWWAARRFALHHAAEAVSLMAQRQQITPEEFRASEHGLNYPGPAAQNRLLAPGGPLARSISQMSALMQASGGLHAGAPLPQLSAAFLVTP
mgnify:CR=1 FL=1